MMAEYGKKLISSLYMSDMKNHPVTSLTYPLKASSHRKIGLTTFIALPGPNDEVSVCIDTVVRGISEGWSKEILAGELARILRTRLKEKIGVMMHYHHNA